MGASNLLRRYESNSYWASTFNRGRIVLLFQVATLRKDDYEKLKLRIPGESQRNLVLSTSYDHKVIINLFMLFGARNQSRWKMNELQIWLVGDELTEKEQSRASKGTIFIPYTQIPPRKLRKDCFYHSTPAMIIPPSLDNMHSCEVRIYSVIYTYMHRERETGW